MNRLRLLLVFALFGGVAFLPAPARACAVCFGRSDSPLASGMNWGIFTLLCFVAVVLSGFAAFMIYLARKSARTNQDGAGDVPETSR